MNARPILQKALPQAIVVCHWRVVCQDWIVVRPLHDHLRSVAYCVRSNDWEDSFNDDVKRENYKTFLSALEESTVRDLPAFENNKGQSPKWLEILGWLARDCECGYRQANEWRHVDSNLGKPADLNSNSLMLQWLCGLRSQEEANLRKEHWRLLADRAKIKIASDKVERNYSTLDENLREAVNIPPPAIASEEFGLAQEQPDVGQQLVKYVSEKIQSLKDLLTDVISNSPTSKLQSDVKTLESQLSAAQNAAGIAGGKLMQAKTYQRGLEHSADQPSILNKCVANPCELRDQFRRAQEAGADPANREHLLNAPDQIEEIKTEESAAIKKRDELKQQLDVRMRLTQFSNLYTQVLQRIFGDAAKGTIQVDGDGLKPKPDKKLTPSGRALTAMATVVSFDLACLAASISGIGNHPGFLIHDSPREGETEMPLFNRLFDSCVSRYPVHCGRRPWQASTRIFRHVDSLPREDQVASRSMDRYA